FPAPLRPVTASAWPASAANSRPPKTLRPPRTQPRSWPASRITEGPGRTKPCAAHKDQSAGATGAGFTLLSLLHKWKKALISHELNRCLAIWRGPVGGSVLVVLEYRSAAIRHPRQPEWNRNS